MREAGYDPLSMTQRIPDDVLLSKLGDFITELGRFPVKDEFNINARNCPGFPIWKTVRKRYGGMRQTAAALLEYSRRTGNSHLQQLCEDRLQRETSKPMAESNGRPAKASKIGFVYLKYSPSLRLYKIGKANNPRKRGAGISLLLPEDLVSKHEIRTDHPFILEKYWEVRFREKKKQGEWYELNAADIKSFKACREFLFNEFFP